MYDITVRKKIIGAFIVGFACIALAFIFRSDVPTTGSEDNDAITVTAAPERTAVTITDSNQDGVPDWQEALQGTSAIEITSTSTDYQPPETLTDQFALEFFEQMIRSGNSGAFGASAEELVDVSSDALLVRAADEPITQSEILTTNDNSPQALAAYGEAVATVIKQYEETGGENEAKILERAIQNQSETELAKLDQKITAYQNFFTYTKEIPVPSSLTAYHLALINIYQAQANTLSAMRQVFKDPMLALVRLKRYQDDTNALGETIVGVYTEIINRGGSWDSNSVVYTLIATP